MKRHPWITVSAVARLLKDRPATGGNMRILSRSMRLKPASRSIESCCPINFSVSIQASLPSIDHFDRKISIMAWTQASAGLIVPIKSRTLMTRSLSWIILNGTWDAFVGERLFETLFSTRALRKWHWESRSELSAAEVEVFLGGKVAANPTDSMWKRDAWITDRCSLPSFASTSASRCCLFTRYCEDAWVSPWSSPIIASMPECMMRLSQSWIPAPNTSNIMASKVTFFVNWYKSIWLPSNSED